MLAAYGRVYRQRATRLPLGRRGSATAGLYARRLRGADHVRVAGAGTVGLEHPGLALVGAGGRARW